MPTVSFAEALRVWATIGLASFGGPAAQIALMHRVLVDEKRWIDEARFMHALNFCMLLPGPEAMQLATYSGWLLHGRRGGIAAGLLFVLPGFVAILALSLIYTAFADVGIVGGLFFGLKAAVLAVVIEALVRISRRVLKRPATLAIAGGAFIAIFAFAVPFPAIIAAAALIGFVVARAFPAWLGATDATPSDSADGTAPSGSSAFRSALGTAGIGLLLWLGPIGLLAWMLGANSVYVELGLFFSKAAVVTFGGAYAVLAYVAQQAVEVHGWLAPGEMLDGLGMAETTPGPLIQVVQFVGYMGAWRESGDLPPALAGFFGAVVVTWVTFVPCFLWIFLGAPWIDRLRNQPALAAALTAITAAVVGVILNLAIWFGLHVLFARVGDVSAGPISLPWPDPATFDPAALAIAAAAALALLRFRVGIIPVVLMGAVLGAFLRGLGAFLQ